MGTVDEDRLERRRRIVEEHVGRENLHDLAGIVATFGESARYEDQPWGERFDGQEGVRTYYQSLLAGLPDLRMDLRHRHVTDEAIVLELVVRGTHLGPWRGLPANGRRLEFPLCAVYTFDGQDKLAGERIYYDRATVMRQLGILHEPESLVGRVLIPVMHPLTVVRAAARMIFGKTTP